jgi:hypothetical protein
MSSPTTSPEPNPRRDDSDSDSSDTAAAYPINDPEASIEGIQSPPAIRRSLSGVVAGTNANLRTHKHLRFSSISSTNGGPTVSINTQEETVVYPGGAKTTTGHMDYYITEPATPNISET